MAQHLAWLCGIRSEESHLDDALRTIEHAIELIGAQPLEAIHGTIYQMYSHVLMLVGRRPESIVYGEQAYQIALECGDSLTAIGAHISIGSSLLRMDEDAGVQRLELSAEQAKLHA